MCKLKQLSRLWRPAIRCFSLPLPHGHGPLDGALSSRLRAQPRRSLESTLSNIGTYRAEFSAGRGTGIRGTSTAFIALPTAAYAAAATPTPPVPPTSLAARSGPLSGLSRRTGVTHPWHRFYPCSHVQCRAACGPRRPIRLLLPAYDRSDPISQHPICPAVPPNATHSWVPASVSPPSPPSESILAP